MSARRRQADSDPLPYVQVDRAVKPKVALLAGAMGVSTQHALGSVVEFWDLCGDPRELERVVESTPEGAEPEVVLPNADVELRFKLASGRDVPTETLAAVGLVETRGDRARVRGMSRYFEPVLKRISARKAASAGGKASAEARRKAYGTAQPRSGAGSEVGSTVASSGAQATPEATPKRPRSDVRSDAEAESNPSGQRSAVSGQRLVEEAPPPLTVVEKAPAYFFAPTTPPDTWSGEDFFAWAQALRQKAGFVGERRRPRDLSSWWSTALMTPGVTVERLQQAFIAFGDSKHWQTRTPPLPFGGFVSQWDQFLGREVRHAS